MKRIIIMIILFVFLFSNSAFGEEYTELAEKLKEIGVFKGTENGFELDREPTRVEGLIMFIRLIGKEDEALEQDWSHPFTDVPSWADRYVGWAFQHGYINGISETQFGTGNIKAKSFITLLLRAFGYDDSRGDFNWENSIEKAREIGIIDHSKANELNTKKFLRDDVVFLLYNALNVNLKDSNITLKENIEQKETNTYEKHMGNTYSNIANMGIVIKKGEYLFYKNGQNGLVKYNITTNEKETIYKDPVNNMNIVNDLIYFRNEKGIYCINISNNEVKLIHEFNYSREQYRYGTMFLIDNYIYFKGDTYGIEKIKLDGTEHKVLYDEEIYDFIVYEDKIYFTDEKENKFYIMNTDGTDMKLFMDIDLWYYLDASIKDGWIYFEAKLPNTDYQQGIYRAKLDGSDIELIGENVSEFNADGSVIVYVNVRQEKANNTYNRVYEIHTVNHDGSNDTILVKGIGNINNLNIVDDKGVFYNLFVDENNYSYNNINEYSGFYFLDLKTLKKTLIYEETN